MIITRRTVQANLDAAIRVAFVSDLHDTPNEPILDAIDCEKVDVILGGGDYIHSNMVYERGLDFLRSAAERYPVYCSLGNHEKRFKGDIQALIEATGAVVLNNNFGFFRGLCIGGLTSGWYQRMEFFEKTPPPKTEWLSDFEQQEGFKILLNHHPEYYEPYLKERKIDLILSGHAHGGQWRLFGQGLLAPGQGLFPKYTGGVHDGRLMIGRGLGNYHPIPRIFNPPELIILDIV